MPIAKTPANCRVLIVDDMASMRALLKVTLRQLGFQRIDEAADGAKAIQRLAGPGYDLMICDWDMPGATGLEVLRHVRAEPRLQALPFVMLTANSLGSAVQQAIDAGVTDYVTKPFRPETLVGKLQRLLGEPGA